MLLIGSRAIRYHFPDFREPRDWDLIGTDEDIARFDRILPRSERHAQRPDKTFYMYGDDMVEVANASVVPYWKTVCERFENGPVVEDPVLGALRIPSAAYLLATKQCGLIYRVHYWHKNLEDIFWLKARIHDVSEDAADLLELTYQDAKRLRAENHARSARTLPTCHPEVAGPRDEEIHRALHERWVSHFAGAGMSASSLGDRSRAWRDDAWLGFPREAKEQRRERMIDWFAEEAWVLAAEQHLAPSLTGKEASEDELVRWALRELITSHIPEGWRYFGVNHYGDIAARVPRVWKSDLVDLARPRPSYDRSTGWTSFCSGRPREPRSVFSR